MSSNQCLLRNLLDQQSRHRQRCAEIAATEGELTPELRSELETLE